MKTTTITLNDEILNAGIAFAKERRVSLSIVLETLLKELLEGKLKVSIPLVAEEEVKDEN